MRFRSGCGGQPAVPPVYSRSAQVRPPRRHGFIAAFAPERGARSDPAIDHPREGVVTNAAGPRGQRKLEAELARQSESRATAREIARRRHADVDA